MKKQIAAHVKEKGESVNAFNRRAIDKTIEWYGGIIDFVSETPRADKVDE